MTHTLEYISIPIPFPSLLFPNSSFSHFNKPALAEQPVGAISFPAFLAVGMWYFVAPWLIFFCPCELTWIVRVSSFDNLVLA
jgi:hypothetical protein